MLKNSPKKIVIIGSAGVGKTTLFENIKKRLKINAVPEQARVICKKLGYKNIYEIKDQNKFRYQVLIEQIKAENKYTNFISDRSTIDCWAHWVRWSWNNAKSYESEKYYQLAYKQSKKYSHIIFIPRIIDPVEDGFRWNDIDYQNQIERIMINTLREWELMRKTYFIKSKKANERLKEVLNFIV